MPLSGRFTAFVPVATGNIYEDYRDGDSAMSFVLRELFKIATYVDKDAFWRAQIDQIFVTAESELVLVPKLGNHQIIFGNTEQMEDKFNRLMLFYREALSRVGWDKYKAINLRYRGQVVAVKR
jgi:cell division protein FtsQ